MLSVDAMDVRIGDVTILSDVSLTVEDRHTVAVLGPSGSGKSTLLRAIAGLVDVTSGDIRWDGESVIGVPTHLRGFGLMFQGYALFPHLNVGENVGFGLKMKGEQDIEAQVGEALEWVGLAGFGLRTIDSLSGGEQQRVAMARTLAPRPRLIMLDEPLGALDRELRRRLLDEIHEILEKRKVTALIVTHDRDEAAALSDTLALMRDGRIVQTGSLEEILANPFDQWVSGFLG